MKKNLFQVPISFHVFNRPNLTKEVFKKIREMQPSKLFITADGPRKNVLEDKEKCKEVRTIINQVDWDCQVYTNFSKINKGAYKSISDGITWVFQNVDRAIILEDDCIPNSSFFKYCHNLLDYYENDKRVAIISGNNFQLTGNNTEYSYYFSRYTHIWGWATWKRTWDQVDLSMKDWPEYRDMKGLHGVFSRWNERKYWYQFYQEMYEGKRKPHWDFKLLLSTFMNNNLSIIPNTNLVTNIGFGKDAANIKEKSDRHFLDANTIDLPLNHPPFLTSYIEADDFTERKIFSRGLYGYAHARFKHYCPEIIFNIIKFILNIINRKKYT